MKRILLLITDLEIGGTPTVVRELAIRLRAGGGCEVQVACLKGFGPVATQLQQAGVTVKAFSASATMDLPAVVGELRQYVRDHHIDTVFSFLVHANVVAALASRGVNGVRWLQSIQTTQPSPRWHWWLQRIAQHGAERVAAPSESVATVARDWADVPAEKIVVIPNAVDVVCSTGVSTVSDGTRHGRDARVTRVGFIGRLDPVKRLPDLITALSQLPAGITLDVWGEGSARKQIEATIAKFNLADRVTLHGAIASPATALQQIDCLVLPSAAEGFGLVLIEAMAAGVPVVATDVAGIRDVVRSDHNGLLVPVGQSAILATAIQRVLTDADLRLRLISNGRREVEARFTWDRVLPMYRSFLEV
ncbi:glycosyltransferase family 4 protein [soil metagenome]